MPRPCRTRTRASTSCCPPSASCSRPTMSARPASCCGSANPAAGSASRVGRRLASSGSSFASSAEYVPADSGRPLSSLVGYGCSPARALRVGDEYRACNSDVRVSLSIARALGRRVPDLLWARPQSVSRLGRGPSVTTRSRSHRAPSLAEPRRRSRPRGARGVSGNRDHKMNGSAMTSSVSPWLALALNSPGVMMYTSSHLAPQPSGRTSSAVASQ